VPAPGGSALEEHAYENYMDIWGYGDRGIPAIFFCHRENDFERARNRLPLDDSSETIPYGNSILNPKLFGRGNLMKKTRLLRFARNDTLKFVGAASSRDYC
jgi:hypothetical protein